MPTKTAKRPNILWVSFEDTNPFYPCYGDHTAKLPNLDWLASEGTVYKNCFSTAGVCAPSRSAIITGMYPTSIGTHHMRTGHRHGRLPSLPSPYEAVLPHYVKLIPEYLRAAGYYCTNNEKTDYQFNPPFTAWDDCSKEAHFRNRQDKDQPFFAVFNPTITHESGMWEENNSPLTVNPESVPLPPYFPDTPKVRKSVAKMYSNLERADAILGMLIQELKEDGLLENTIIMHWSDHGPLPRGKRYPYDSGIHVPLIIRWPQELKKGAYSDELISTVDLGPTILSLAGLEVPAHLQGRAFLGAQAKGARQFIYASRDRHDETYDMVRAIRSKKYKYIRNYYQSTAYLPWVPYLNHHPIVQELRRCERDGLLNETQKLLLAPSKPAEELYDLENDPFEINNLAREPRYQTELNELSEKLSEWQRTSGDLGLISEIDMVRNWYPNGQQPHTSSPVLVPMNPQLEGLIAHVPGTWEKIESTQPSELLLVSETQGASIAYMLKEDGATNPIDWKLYVGPIPLTKGKWTLRTKAIRIGYTPSKEVEFTIHVRETLRP